MAVPKKRVSKSKSRRQRTINARIKVPALSPCPDCGQLRLPHRVCVNCGKYADRTYEIPKKFKI
jgi:large subunit ribosomal protein L32